MGYYVLQSLQFFSFGQGIVTHVRSIIDFNMKYVYIGSGIGIGNFCNIRISEYQ